MAASSEFSPGRLIRDLRAPLAAGAAYYVTAIGSLELSLVGESVTPVWPPTGIALFALLVVGWRALPTITAAAFLVNLPISPGAVTAGAIALGNTLAPALAAVMLRAGGFDARFRRTRDAVSFVIVALGTMAVSATVGAAALFGGAAISAPEFPGTFAVWWAGDAIGAVVVAPALFALRALVHDDERWFLHSSWLRRVEGLAVLAGTGLAGFFVFHNTLRILYLVFPLVAWASVRFEFVGAVGAVVTAVAIGLWAAIDGAGPFAAGTLAEKMITMQSFAGGVSLTAYMLAAATTERRAARERAEGAWADLEVRVRERTAELSTMNDRLAAEVVERERAQAALRDAYEREHEVADRLRQVDAMKDAFLLAISHELRTPLTVVIGLSETLRRSEVREDAETAGELLDRLSINARRLERLLSDLLDLDRLRRGVVEPHRQPTDIAGALYRAAESIEVDSHRVGVRAHSFTAVVDAAQVERIVENLVANAVRHTPPGTHVDVVGEQVPGGVLITVEDDGPGIPEDIKATLFEPFTRGNERSHSPGTGLGLSLVAYFASLHGGRVWVEDRPGGGSLFGVFLADPGLADPRAVPAAAS